MVRNKGKLWSCAVALAVTSGVYPDHARAECPPGLIRNALAARIDASAFELIKQPLLAKLPTDLEIPEAPFTVIDCPSFMDDMVVTPKQGKMKLAVTDLTIATEERGVRIAVTLDFDAEATLDMVMCGTPNAVCPAKLAAKGLTLSALFAPAVGDCVASFPILEMPTPEVDPGALTLNLEQCAYAYSLALVISNFPTIVIGTLMSTVRDLIQQNVPPLVDSFAQSFFSSDFNLPQANLRLAIVPQEITTSAEGLVAVFSADAALDRTPATTCMPNDLLPPDRSDMIAEPPQFSRAPLSFVASRPIVQRVLDQAWSAGWLCLDSREMPLDLSGYVSSIVPNAKVDFKVLSTTAPVLELAPEPGRHLRLATDNLAATIIVQVGDDAPAVANATVKAAIQGELGVSPSMRQLLVLPRELAASSSIEVALPNSQLGISKQSVAGFIENLVLPAFSKKLGSLPVTSSILLAAPFAFSIESIAVAPAQVRADMNLWPVDEKDAVAPSTSAVAPARPSPPDLVIELTSSDDQTPPEFLRHQVWIDGQPQPDLYAGRLVSLTGLKGGGHSIRLVAFDVADNEDLTSLTLPVVIDAQSPVVTFTEAPRGGLQSTKATLRFVAKDDYAQAGEITFRYKVGVVSRANEPDVLLGEGDLGVAHELKLVDLPDGEVIRVRVYAKDTAGNEGEGEAAFAITKEPDYGCAAMPPSGLLALVCLALEWWCRARTRGTRA